MAIHRDHTEAIIHEPWDMQKRYESLFNLSWKDIQSLATRLDSCSEEHNYCGWCPTEIKGRCEHLWELANKTKSEIAYLGGQTRGRHDKASQIQNKAAAALFEASQLRLPAI